MPKSSSGDHRRRTRGIYVIRWLERHCVHTQGEWIGRPFRLLPWQKRLILQLFEVGADELRRYRWALWGVPKKQGKSELAAALALFFLIADGEPSPLVACAASSEEQADLVFGAAKKMCDLSPTLASVTERYDKKILVPSIPGAELRRIAAVAGANDGPSWHVVICDELHEWAGKEDDITGRKGRDVWNILTNGIGARRQPMVLQITTAGYDLETVCGEQYLHCRAVQNGEQDDPTYHFFWQEAPKGADYRNPEVWKAANPSFGVTVQEAFYRDQLTKKPENIFRRYFLNQWTASEHTWLAFGAWDACQDTGEVEIPEHAQVVLGVDIGLKRDRSAVVALWKRPDGRIVPQATVWKPPPDGTALELSLVEEKIRQLARRHEVLAVAYDPWKFERSAQQLTSEGLRMIDFPQSNERMGPASEQLFEAINARKIAHDGAPTLAAHVEAGETRELQRGFRLYKRKGGPFIDALIAMCIAYSEIDEAGSVYESRGLFVV